jgi:hypothetical protein
MPEHEENTPQKLGLGLPSVKEVPEEEGKEETEESLPKGEHSTETRTWTTFSEGSAGGGRKRRNRSVLAQRGHGPGKNPG